MKKKTKVIIAAVIVLAAAVTAGVLVYGSRMKTVLSVAKSAGMSTEDIASKSEENDRITQSVREQYDVPEVVLNDDVLAGLSDGSISLEEAAQMLLESRPDVAVSAEPSGETPSGTVQESTAVTPESSGTTPQTTQNQTPESSSGTAAQPVDSTQTEPSVPDTTAAQPATVPETDTPATSEPPQTAQTQTPESSGTAAQPDDSTQTEPSDSTVPVETPQVSEEQQRIQNLVTQMYVLRSTFTGRVDEIVASCVAEFLALDVSEQTTANKIRIVTAHLDEVAGLEEDCDRQVADIVSQLRELDPALADQVAQQYQNEKDLKKAQLVAQYS